MSNTKDTESARRQAIAQYEAVREMVAALECDYDRLEELDTEENNDDIANLRESAEATELVELREKAGGCSDRDDAEQRIQEDALSVEVRTGWFCPTEHQPAAEEFRILLCTGGPAVQIRGELSEYCEPVRAWIEYQDWFTGWQRLVLDAGGSVIDQDTLLAYARCFYFGEG